jgi:hypothetical protein
LTTPLRSLAEGRGAQGAHVFNHFGKLIPCDARWKDLLHVTSVRGNLAMDLFGSFLTWSRDSFIRLRRIAWSERNVKDAVVIFGAATVFIIVELATDFFEEINAFLQKNGWNLDELATRSFSRVQHIGHPTSRSHFGAARSHNCSVSQPDTHRAVAFHGST